MQTTQRRMIVVAAVVCGFAVGMAGLLNYFKYQSTSQRLVSERLSAVGGAIESSVSASLALGLQFGDIDTLPATLARERATDELIQDIDVFDTEGQILYSTQRTHVNQQAPEAWREAVQRRPDQDWQVNNGEDAAVAQVVKNSFGLPMGYVAVRYSAERVRESTWAVGRTLALWTLAMFALSATLASLAMLLVSGKLTRDVRAVEAALRSGESASLGAAEGPFGAALKRFMRTTREAERDIVGLRTRLQGGHGAAAGSQGAGA